jgi:hypothetical protein
MPQTALSAKHCFDIRVQAAPGVNIGSVSLGQRAVVTVTGGTLVGSGIDAEVVPGGGDWILADTKTGWLTLDVRIVAKTKEGVGLYIRYVSSP